MLVMGYCEMLKTINNRYLPVQIQQKKNQEKA